MSVDSSILSLTASVHNRFDSIAALRSQSLLPFETKAKIQAGKPPRPRIRLCFQSFFDETALRIDFIFQQCPLDPKVFYSSTLQLSTMAFQLAKYASRAVSASQQRMALSATSAVANNDWRSFFSTNAERPPKHAMLSTDKKVKAPPMVYIAGEEMTHYACELFTKEWFEPYFDITSWERYDLSCKARDETNDQVLHDAVEAGKRIGAIFKEPTITPTAEQKEEMGLTRSFGSPNGAMRRGWNGITISRDTIHIDGIELGYKNPVLFERHAVGGEYGAGWDKVGKGTLLTTYLPQDGSAPFVVDKRDLTDDNNVVVVYHVSTKWEK